MAFEGILICLMSFHAHSFNMLTTDFGNHSLLHLDSLNLTPPHLQTQQLTINIHEEDLNRSVDFSQRIVDGMKRLEINLDLANIHVKYGSPSHGQLIDSDPEPEALIQGKAALVAAKATMQLMFVHCAKLNPSDCIKQISQLSMTTTLLNSSCPASQHICTLTKFNSPYYSSDGLCNNNVHDLYGKSFTGYKRILPANYVDTVQEPRTRSHQTKKLLPMPRLISTTLTKYSHIEDEERTLAVMQWGEFIEHDLVHTATSKMVHFNKTIECCDTDGSSLSPRYLHPSCRPVSIPEDDTFYAQYGISCMSYVRSVIAMNLNCNFGAVDQMNQATHFLDGSQIYGPNINTSNSLRKFTRGQLNFRKVGSSEFPHISENSTEDCQHTETSCYISGDPRVNSLPQLAAMHILWRREHNRVATILAHINTNWNDETLYHEARKIVIAEIQHITYNEWLPAVLGKKYVSKMQQTNYSSQVDPRVTNSFATAGLRFITSLMQDKLNLYSEDRKVYSSLNLKDHFNKPRIVEEGNNLDGLIRGLATQYIQRLDLDYVEDVTNHLYNSGEFGYDILSLDIQRGRDHGLPTYTSVRSFCSLPEIQEFSDLSDVMRPETIDALKKLYQRPEDIDLLVGGMSEMPDGDTLVGPTLSCIISDQLVRTRNGDRYFYDNRIQPKPLTKDQRAEIETVTLARIFCDNSNAIDFMQPRVFKHLTKSNQLSSCTDGVIPQINLKLWKDSSR